MDVEERRSLDGSLQKVTIGKAINGRKANSSFGGTPIEVFNGNDYIGRECLVRFYPGADFNPPCAKFITANVPIEFRGLSNDEYALLGKQRFSIPNLEGGRRYDYMAAFNKHYDPFTLSFAFVDQEYSFTPVVYELFDKRCKRFEIPIGEYLERDPPSRNAPHIFIGQNSDVLSTVHLEVVRAGRFPVPMDFKNK